MKKPSRVPCMLLLAGICLYFLAACGAPPSQQAPQTSKSISFTDDSGTQITLSQSPQRISCLTGICIDILAELGVEPVSVVGPLGEDPHYFGEQAKKFLQIGGGFGEENIEDVVKSRPDLVIGLEGVHEKLREGLKSIAPLYIMGPASYEDSIKLLKDIGRLMGREGEAEQAVKDFQAKLDHYKTNSPKNRSALIMAGSGPEFGIETNVALVGGLFAETTSYPWPPSSSNTSGHESGFETYTLEKVLAVDPDVIFVTSFVFGNGKPLSEQLATSPVWKELKAVKNKQVYEVNTEIWGTGRGTLSLSIILDEGMHRLYPDIFKG